MTQTMTASAAPAPTGPMPTGGRWGWYRDHEGNEYRRVSRLVKYAETDQYNLIEWYKRQVAEGLAIRDDLVLAVKAMGRPNPIEGWSRADKDKLNSIAKDAMNAAKQADGARKGTALHDLTERLDRGEGIESVVAGLPAGDARTLRAYGMLRDLNGWRTMEIERTVVLDELEVAGTFDRIDYIPGLAALLGPGKCQHGHGAGDKHFVADSNGTAVVEELPVIADVKSETSPWLNGLHIGPQLGIYSRARRMWRATGGMVKVTFGKQDPVDFPAGEYVPVPCVRQDVGVVIHVSDGDAVPYFVNLHEGFETARAAYAQMLREGRAKTELGTPGAWFVAMPNVRRPEAGWVAQQAAAVAADRGGQHCLVCQTAVTPGVANCRQCGNPVMPSSAGTAPAAPVEQVAVPRSDGMVGWQTSAGGVLDEVDKSAIEAVWAARELGDLAETFRIYTEVCERT